MVYIIDFHNLIFSLISFRCEIYTIITEEVNNWHIYQNLNFVILSFFRIVFIFIVQMLMPYLIRRNTSIIKFTSIFSLSSLDALSCFI